MFLQLIKYILVEKQCLGVECFTIFYGKIKWQSECCNIRYWSTTRTVQFIGQFFPKTTWYSFEPYESSYELLNSNLQYNNITNVSTYKIGMSNIKGTDILFVPNKKEEKGGLNCLARKIDGRINLHQCEQIYIETDTIDNLFINTPINYIKIDIEGFELNVLIGGINTISKYRSFILMEYNHINMKTCDITPNMVDNFFIKLNYNYIIIDDEERFYYPV